MYGVLYYTSDMTSCTYYRKVNVTNCFRSNIQYFQTQDSTGNWVAPKVTNTLDAGINVDGKWVTIF